MSLIDFRDLLITSTRASRKASPVVFTFTLSGCSLKPLAFILVTKGGTLMILGKFRDLGALPPPVVENWALPPPPVVESCIRAW